MMELSPTPRDYAELLRMNPLAAEQLKVIILRRMLDESMTRPDEPPEEGRVSDIE